MSDPSISVAPTLLDSFTEHRYLERKKEETKRAAERRDTFKKILNCKRPFRMVEDIGTNTEKFNRLATSMDYINLFRGNYVSTENIFGKYEYDYDCYQTYLYSEQWKKIAEGIKERGHGVCWLCKSLSGVGIGKIRISIEIKGIQENILPYNLCVHHLSYENIYREKDHELIPLCKRCHTIIHKLAKEPYFQFLDPHKADSLIINNGIFIGFMKGLKIHIVHEIARMIEVNPNIKEIIPAFHVGC